MSSRLISTLRSFAGPALAVLVVGVLALGCNSGKRDGKVRFATGPTGPPTGATLEYIAHPFSATPFPQLIGDDAAGQPRNVLALVFTLEAQGGDILVDSITFESHGDTTPLPNERFSLATVAEDANDDGQLDATELGSGVSVNLAMTQTPEKFTIPFTTSLRLNPTGRVRFFLLLLPDSQLLQPGDAGSDVQVDVVNANDLIATDANLNQVTPTISSATPGNGSGTVVVGFTDHPVISEVQPNGSGAGSQEFIEIFNASPIAMDLSTVYLSNHTTALGNADVYHRLPTGADFGFAGGDATADTFTVRFPANTTLAPGQTIVVAVDGQGYAQLQGAADFCLRNPGAGGGATAVQMLTWDGTATGGVPNFTNASGVGGSVGLYESGDNIHLFMWDGQSDVVVDLDILNFGANTLEVDKSGVSIDGPDADVTPTAYNNETDANTQQTRQPGGTATGQSVTRVDFTEGGEGRAAGIGNGVLDAAGNPHDETSEDWNTTFQLRPSTPGVP